MNLRTELKKGSMATLILSLLAEGPMYGYLIAREIERRSQGYFAAKEGTLYPALHKLEQEGLVSAEWRPAGEARRRRYYHLTDSGHYALADAAAEWRLFSAYLLGMLGQAAAADH